MEYEMIDLPWNKLLTKRYIYQLQRENYNTKTVSDLTSRLRERRKVYLGTGTSLVQLVTEQHKPTTPDEEAVAYLQALLTSYCLEFVHRDGTPDEKANYLDYEDFFNTFFKYGLYMYTTDEMGEESIDDLILLAKCYAKDPDVYRIVAEDCLPKYMVDEMSNWVGYPGEHPECPRAFEDYVMSAVAALVGTMRQPC